MLKLEASPVGFCSKCLEALEAGRDVESHQLPDGSALLVMYCPEHEAGATLHHRPGAPAYWRLTVPIDAAVWRTSVDAQLRAREVMTEMRQREAGQLN